MEDLQRLAAVNATLQLLISRQCLRSGEPSSDDLLLAQFLLCAEKQCKHAEEFVSKIRSLSENLVEICKKSSSDILEELFNNARNTTKNMDRAGGYVEEHCNASLNQRPSEPTITLNALERARSTLEDFCRSYFMFHNMNAQSPRDLFKHLPILAFVESYIYQLDEQNEASLHRTTPTVAEQVKVGTTIKYADTQEYCFAALRTLLAGKRLLTKRITDEMKHGLCYWNLERSLCKALLENDKISLHDVMRAAHYKSFDYRILNLLLYKLSNREVNSEHMDFLSVSEFLVEISDDLFDYEEDVLNNSFNILRMFVRIYGPPKAPSMLAQVITEAEERYNQLLEKLGPVLSSQYCKRCKEAVVEGGGLTSHPMGSWTIPPIIVDEVAYRQQVNNSN